MCCKDNVICVERERERERALCVTTVYNILILTAHYRAIMFAVTSTLKCMYNLDITAYFNCGRASWAFSPELTFTSGLVIKCNSMIEIA